jgi:hypothetical protein
VLGFKLTRGLPDILDGVSSDDLAEETLLDFFESADALGWDEQRDLANFLCGVLRNKFLDRLRRQRRHDGGSVDDPNFNISPPESAWEQPSAHSALETQERIDALKTKTNSDGELVELIDAIGDTNGDYNINQQLAEDMGTTVTDIVNRRKRLKRLVEQKGTA